MTDFLCTFCGRPRAGVGKLVSGFDAFICDRCVATCLDAAAKDREADAAVVMIRPVGPETPPTVAEFHSGRGRRFGPYPTSCGFCGKTAAEVRAFFQGYLDCVCSECIGLCIDIMVEDLGGEWKARQSTWPEAGRQPPSQRRPTSR